MREDEHTQRCPFSFWASLAAASLAAALAARVAARKAEVLDLGSIRIKKCHFCDKT